MTSFAVGYRVESLWRVVDQLSPLRAPGASAMGNT